MATTTANPMSELSTATVDTAARLAKVFDDYEVRLRQSNAVDFDDLLLETVANLVE